MADAASASVSSCVPSCVVHCVCCVRPFDGHPNDISTYSDGDWALIVSGRWHVLEGSLDSSGLSSCLHVENNDVISWYKINEGTRRRFFCK